MIRRSEITTKDALGTPNPGVYVTVKDAQGNLAAIYDDAGAALANPFTTGGDGSFYYNVLDDAPGTYTEEYRLSLASSPRETRAVVLSDVSIAPRPLFYGWKSPARTLNDALRVIAALPGMVVGYAAGTTGGNGGTRFLVQSSSADANQPNTFNDCYTRARALGGTAAKIIHFDTRGHFNVFVPTNLILDAVMNNISIAAPGFNVTFWTDPLVSTVSITGKNSIFYGIEFRTLPGTLAAQDDVSGVKSEKKLVAVDPTVCDLIAFINCEFRHSSDGCLDMAGTILAGQAQCRVSVINCIFWDSDQPMMLGSGDPLCTASDPAILKVTLYNNIFAYCAERKPKVLGRADVHVVNMADEFLPFRRDQLPPTNEISAAYGATAMFGGTLTIDSALWMSADGVTGRSATIIDSVANGVGTMIDGAIQVLNSAAEDGMTIQTGNTSRIPTRPYVLTGLPVPAAGPDRDAWIANLWTICGARPNSAPRGEWVHTDNTTDYPNGDTVLRSRSLGGRYLRVDSPNEYKALGDWPVMVSGYYTPTLTAVTNCSALTVARSNYQASNKRVTAAMVVSGTITTSATSLSIGISLPIAADLTVTADVEGSCNNRSATNPAGGYVSADTTNDRAQATITLPAGIANGGAFTLGVRFTYMLP